MKKIKYLILISSLIYLASNYATDKTLAQESDLIKSAITDYNKANYIGSKKILNEILKTEPNNFVAIYYLAMSYQALKQYDLASINYNKIIELAPNSKLASYAKIGLKNLSHLHNSKQSESITTFNNNNFNQPINNQNKAISQKHKLPDNVLINYTTDYSTKQMTINMSIEGANTQAIFNPAIRGILINQNQLAMLGLNLQKIESAQDKSPALGINQQQNGSVYKVKINLGNYEFNNIDLYVVKDLQYNYPIVGDVLHRDYYIDVSCPTLSINFIKKDSHYIPDGIDVPFEYDSGKVLISGFLNTIPAKLYLDPGCPELSLTQAQASYFRVVFPRNRFQPVNGLSGYGQGRIGYLNFIEIGPIQANNVACAVRSFQSAYPVLGQDILNNWEYIILNDQNKVRFIGH